MTTTAVISHKHLLIFILATLLFTITHTHEQHSSHDHDHDHDHHHNQQPQMILPESQSQQRQPDDTDNMMDLSRLIISTIQKYDHTEKGVIPIDKYDEFLHQIFINGNKFNKLNKDKSQVPEDIGNLLREATKEFKTFRYSKPVLKNGEQSKPQAGQGQQPKKEFVELQEFYMDLIKHFSEFLTLDQYAHMYLQVSDYFFVDQQSEKQSKNTKTDQQSDSDNNEKLEL